jgi:ankyrin repeat protein
VDPANDALFRALRAGDAAGVERALEGGADPDAPTPLGLPLCVAAAAGWTDGVRLLIDGGADPDVLGDDDRSPLRLALDGDHREVVAVLRAAGAEEDPSPSPERALFRAVDADDGTVVSRLLAAGAELEARDQRTPTLGMTPLLVAAGLGRINALQALLVAGAQVDARQDRFGSPGLTALGWAALRGQAGAARRLLLAGAEVDLPGENERTPLAEAARGDRPELVQLLVEAGAVVDARDGDGRTPLLLAALEGGPGAAEALLRAGADVHATDPGQTTSLAAAVRRNDPELVRLLLGAGADPRWRTGEASVAEEAMELGGAEVRRLVGAALGVANEDALARRSSRPPPESVPGIEVDLDEGALDLANGGGPFDGSTLGTAPLGEPAGGLPSAEHDLDVDDDAISLEELDDDDLELIDDDEEHDDGGGGDEGPDAATGFDEEAPTQGPLPAARPAFPSPQYVVPVRVSELGRYEAPGLLDRLRGASGGEGFGAAIETLSAWVGAAPWDRTGDLGGFEVEVAPGSHLDLDGLQDQLLPLGALVFCAGAATGSHEPGRLIALPSRDPWDAMAVMGTRAPSRGVGTLELIGWMKGLEAKHALNLTWVEPLRISGRFRAPIDDRASEALAADMDDLCPEVVVEGTGSRARLAESLRRTGAFHFWWRV